MNRNLAPRHDRLLSATSILLAGTLAVAGCARPKPRPTPAPSCSSQVREEQIGRLPISFKDLPNYSLPSYRLSHPVILALGGANPTDITRVDVVGDEGSKDKFLDPANLLDIGKRAQQDLGATSATVTASFEKPEQLGGGAAAIETYATRATGCLAVAAAVPAA